MQNSDFTMTTFATHAHGAHWFVADGTIYVLFFAHFGDMFFFASTTNNVFGILSTQKSAKEWQHIELNNFCKIFAIIHPQCGKMCHHSHHRRNVVPTKMSNVDDVGKVFLFFFDFSTVGRGWSVDGWAVVVCNVLISFWFHTNRCSHIRSNRRNLARVNHRLWWRQTEQKQSNSRAREKNMRPAK